MSKKIKQIFFPNWKQVVFNIIGGLGLFFLSMVVQAKTWSIQDYWATGFPIYFLEEWGLCMYNSYNMCSKISLGGLIFDLFFWYLIFSIAVFGFKTLKNKMMAK